MMDVHIAQSATQAEGNFWRWAVWLEGDEETLDRIDHVEYILHPTFPRPVQRVADRGGNFRLDASGWGEFRIYAHIYLQDGSVLKKEHWLALHGATSRGAVPSSSMQATSKGLESLNTEAAAPPTLFLSCSITDFRTAEALSRALQTHGYRVLLSEDLDPDIPLSEMLRTDPSFVNGALLLISKAGSPYLVREVDALHQASVPILPLLLGAEAHLPASLPTLSPLQIKDTSDVEGMAQAVVERLSDELPPHI